MGKSHYKFSKMVMQWEAMMVWEFFAQNAFEHG
jgi:hypothetical protein